MFWRVPASISRFKEVIMIPLKLYLLLGAPQSAGDGAAPGPASFVSTLVPFALIIAIFYFFIIRPQNKKQKETQKMLSALKKGDRVVTIGGLHGTIQNVKESTVVVKVDDNTRLEFSRSAIATVTAEGKAERTEKAEEIEDKKAEDDTGSESKD
jgi:preprotein translocase subunit YajC